MDRDASDGAANDQLRTLLNTNKEKLINYVAHLDKTSYRDVPKIEDQPGGYQVSSAQRRLWILSQFEAANRAYNLSGTYTFTVELNVPVLERCFHELILRHEILRTVFKEHEQDTVRQFVLPAAQSGFRLSYLDLRTTEISGSEFEAMVLVEKERPFDLATGPLLRVNLFRTKAAWTLVYVMHHIVSDGLSMRIMVRELLTLYKAFLEGKTPTLPPLRIQYRDYAAWQQEKLRQKALASERAYWLQQFEGEVPLFELPGDHTRPAVKTFKGGRIFKDFDGRLVNGLQSLVQQQRATLFMGVLAAVKLLMYRYTGQTDIIVGCPVAGREHADLEDQIGFYINTLALRTRIDREETFIELLKKVKKVCLDGFENQEFPFDELVEELDLRRDMSRNPLFDVMVNHINGERGANAGRGDREEVETNDYRDAGNSSCKFDLAFEFLERKEGIRINIEYYTGLFSRSSAVRIGNHLERLMYGIVEQPDVPICRLNFLLPEEEAQMVEEWNATRREYPADKTLIGLFEEQVERTPENVAVVYEGVRLSYRELNERANRLGHHLRATYGVGPDMPVALCLERSEQLLVGLLGILKAGGAYVPIDPDYPVERIHYMLKDTGSSVVVTGEWQLDRLRAVATDLPVTVLAIDGGQWQKESIRYEAANPDIVNKAEDLAYVIYTSGTTGQPKGVMISHQAIVNRLAWMSREYPLSATDRVLQKTPIVFDVSVWELFWAHWQGAGIVFSRPQGHKDSVYLAEVIERHAVTVVHFVPSMLSAFLETVGSDRLLQERVRRLRYLFCSGEALLLSQVKQAHKLLAGAEVHNLYGPTEAAVEVLYYACTDPGLREVLIGRPIDNIRVYILDENRMLLPVGAVGELYIGGVGLARGYWQQPGLTAERFVADPFRRGERMYRTGDLVRYRSTGDIEYLGRNDSQIKLRGYRIELGEVEAKLAAYPGIRQAVVVCREQSGVGKYLAGYYVTDIPLDEQQILQWMGERLPEYMVPSAVMHLSALPLTVNGKLDRRALPDPEFVIADRYMPPMDPIEAAFCVVFGEVLGLEAGRISVEEDFFRLGGNSILAIRLASRLNRVLDRQLSVSDIIEHETIRKLAASARRGRVLIKAPALSDPQQRVLSFAQEWLWFIESFEGGNPAYYIPIVAGLQPEVEVDRLVLALRSVVHRHEVLRSWIRTDPAGIGYQWVQDDEQLPLQVDRVEVSSAEELGTAVQTAVKHIFRLDREYPIAVNVYTVADSSEAAGSSQRYLSVVLHHIAFDSWSTDILIREVMQYYKGEQPAPLQWQYKDFAWWQRQYLSEEVLERQLGYWKGRLSGYEPLRLPTDRLRPLRSSYAGADLFFELEAEAGEQLRAVARELRVSLYSVLLSGYYLLLGAYSDQRDIVIGSPVDNRHFEEMAGVIGFFANTLVLRGVWEPEQEVADFIRSIGQVVTEAQLHKDLPFEKLVQELGVEQDTSRHPVFQVLFSVQYFGGEQRQAAGELFTGYAGGTTAKFDVTTMLDDSGERIRGVFNYVTALFDASTIASYIATYREILRQLAEVGSTAYRRRRISDLRYVSEAEVSPAFSKNRNENSDKY